MDVLTLIDIRFKIYIYKFVDIKSIIRCVLCCIIFTIIVQVTDKLKCTPV